MRDMLPVDGVVMFNAGGMTLETDRGMLNGHFLIIRATVGGGKPYTVVRVDRTGAGHLVFDASGLASFAKLHEAAGYLGV